MSCEYNACRSKFHNSAHYIILNVTKHVVPCSKSNYSNLAQVTDKRHFMTNFYFFNKYWQFFKCTIYVHWPHVTGFCTQFEIHAYCGS